MDKEETYSPDTNLYLILLLAACLVTIGSFFMNPSSRWFTITTGLGCGGIASIIVAWLIDAANCRKRKEKNDDFLNHLFDQFDMRVKNEFQLIIYDCAKQDNKISIEEKYTIAQIEEMLNNADGLSNVWDMRYSNLGEAYASVNVTSLLSFDPIPQHTKLCSIVNTCVSNSRAFQNIRSRCNIEGGTEATLAYLLLCFDVKQIKDIYSLRNLKVEFEVDSQLKESIRGFRNAANKCRLKEREASQID